MTTAYTSLLGLALPVTGELSGTWGDTVNNSITSLLDSAIAGTTTLSTDADVTLTTTTGAANTAREAILLWTAGGTVTRTITAPAQSKIYTVINASSSTQSIKLVGAGPTTGVTILKGESALCAWNGSDFIKISNTAGAGVFSSITNTGLTSGRVVYSTTGGLETDSANLTFNGTTLTANTLNLTNALGTAYGGTGLTSFTANGVVYASSTSALATGSALTFDGTTFKTSAAGTSISLSQSTVNSGVAVSRVSGLNGSGTAVIFDQGVNIVNANAFELYDRQNSQQVDTYISGASGYRQFFLNGSEQMRLTSTGLGIGTSSPALKLDVTGTIRATATQSLILDGSTGTYATIRYNNTSIADIGTGNQVFSGGTTTDLGIAARTGNRLVLGSNGNAQVYLDTSGNLGLGVTPNTWYTGYTAFEFGGYGSLTSRAATNDTELSSNAYRNASATYIYKKNGTAQSFDMANGIFAWNTAASGTAGTAITFTQAMTLDASGNLGIGTTSPGYRFDVQGSAAAAYIVQSITNTSSTGYVRQLFSVGASGANGQADISYVPGTFFVMGPSSNDTTTPIVFRNNNATERARIDSSGNWLVGTTTVTSVASGGFYLSPSSVTGYTFFDMGHATGTASGAAYSYFRYAGSAIGSITQSGTTAVLFNVTSDQRLKENIQDAADAASLIDSLQVRQFDWKADGSHQRYGFVAQELVTVAPEAVHQPADPEEMMAVDYSKLVPMLVKEIQSLRQRLAALEAK